MFSKNLKLGIKCTPNYLEDFCFYVGEIMRKKTDNRMGLQEGNFKQYANRLFEATSKMGINKEKTYLLLSLLIGNSDSSVKKEFSRKRIPASYIDPIRYVLHADTIYIDYFSILLPFYRDQDGKESLIKMKIDILKQRKKQPYWDKWIRLYETKLSDFSDKNIVLEYFQKEAESLEVSIQESVEGIHFLLCSKSLAIKKNFLDLYQKIDKRIHIYERIYRSIFYLTYFSWIREWGSRNRLSATETRLIEKVREISFSKIELYLQELKDVCFIESEEDPILRKSIRLLDLYYSGNRSMCDHEGNFATLPKAKRDSFLDKSNAILKTMQPTIEDELLYRVWHKYYYFLYLQKLVEQDIHDKNYFEVPQRVRLALDFLEDIQKTCRGGFNRIRIKCIYHKRYLEFIWNSIEAYLLEKETLSQFGGISFPNRNHNHFTDDEYFTDTLEWMKEQKKSIHNLT